MNKIYKIMILLQVASVSISYAKEQAIQDSSGAISMNEQQNRTCDSSNKENKQYFRTEQGGFGVYDKNAKMVYIGDDTFIEIKIIKKSLASSKKMRHKLRNHDYLGEYTEKGVAFNVYGKSGYINVYTGPDAGVRTQDKLRADFGEDFGSDQYEDINNWFYKKPDMQN